MTLSLQTIGRPIALLVYYILYWIFFTVEYLKPFFYKQSRMDTCRQKEQPKYHQVKHLGIVRNDTVGEETSICSNLINVILWCLSLGIDTLTFVDSQVVDWSSWVRILCRVENFAKDSCILETSSCSHLTCTVENKSTGFFVLKLWNRNQTIFTLNLLHSNDAHLSLIRGIHHLVRTKLEEYQMIPISSRKKYVLDFLNSGAEGAMIGCEPQLVVIFGNIPSLVGFPAWEVRLSQIFFQPSFSSFTFRDLKEIVHMTLQTPKRFGT